MIYARLEPPKLTHLENALQNLQRWLKPSPVFLEIVYGVQLGVPRTMPRVVILVPLDLVMLHGSPLGLGGSLQHD